ncbi:MAG: hypothetical protein NT179_05150 [Nitrospirae bacterium]|nr:hypothetical protein [Nitrospirota bacterium]
MVFMFFSRAYTETCKVLDWHKKLRLLVISASAVPIIWFYLWLFGKGNVVFGEMNLAAAGLGAIASIAVAIFLINVFRAPILICREKDQKIAGLIDEKSALEGKLKPVISILCKGNEVPPYYHEGDNFKLLRLGVQNEAFDEIDGVKAKLMGVRLVTEEKCESLFDGKLPAALHLKGNNPPEPPKKEFSINARDCEYIDVVQWVWNARTQPWLQFQWVEQEHPLIGPPGHYHYELDIQVTTRSGGGISRRYITKINPFRLEEVTPQQEATSS